MLINECNGIFVIKKGSTTVQEGHHMYSAYKSFSRICEGNSALPASRSSTVCFIIVGAYVPDRHQSGKREKDLRGKIPGKKQKDIVTASCLKRAAQL